MIGLKSSAGMQHNSIGATQKLFLEILNDPIQELLICYDFKVNIYLYFFHTRCERRTRYTCEESCHACQYQHVRILRN